MSHHKIFSDLRGGEVRRAFSEFVLLTLAAQVTTIPIMAYHFQRISLVSFLANPFILPAQPAVMILGGLAVLLSLIWFPLGQIAAWVAWPFVVYYHPHGGALRQRPARDDLPGRALHLVRDLLYAVLLR